MLGNDPPVLFASGIVSNAYGAAMHWFNRLDLQGWFMVLCAAVLAGLFALRGFGSRSDY
jgi:hypothetical protein